MKRVLSMINIDLQGRCDFPILIIIVTHNRVGTQTHRFKATLPGLPGRLRYV